MRPGARLSAARAALALVAGFVALNAALVFDNVWPTPAIEPTVGVSVEVAVLVLALAGWQALRSRRARWPNGPTPLPRWPLVVAGVIGAILVIGRYLDVTVPSLYGRPVNLVWDAVHLPNLAVMAARSMPAWTLVAGLSAAVAAFWLLAWLCTRATAWMAAGLHYRWLRGAAASVAIAVLAAAGVQGTALAQRWPLLADLGQWIGTPVTAGWLQQARFVALAATPSRAAAHLPPSPPLLSDLSALNGADVLLVFVESYGAAAYDRPEHAAVIAPAQALLAQAARDSGRVVRSAFVRSPTFGGGSWLAHASVLSGIGIADPAHYDLLLSSDRPSLVGVFKAHGYRAVALMPGLHADWPEGRYYGYDTLYDHRSIGYRGPAFGYWSVPDQFSLDAIARLELQRPGRAPVLVVYPTINSHAPFVPLPPYQPDWARLATEQPFDAAPLGEALGVQPDWMDLGPGWRQSIAYTLRSLAGFLGQRAPADAVTVVIGDHQPAASVAGRDAPWDVPVHVITRNPRVVAALDAAGFVDGVMPRRAPIGPMQMLAPLLLRSFDGGSALQVQASAPGTQRVDVP